jgi:hypothetical protein
MQMTVTRTDPFHFAQEWYIVSELIPPQREPELMSDLLLSSDPIAAPHKPSRDLLAPIERMVKRYRAYQAGYVADPAAACPYLGKDMAAAFQKGRAASARIDDRHW